MKLYSETKALNISLRDSIKRGLDSYEASKCLQLPALIFNSSDVWSFSKFKSEPNFVTLLSAKGHVIDSTKNKGDLEGCILMIPSADPGYDWIFSHQIKGLVTKYGGANSHMSIRSAELGRVLHF